MFIFLDIEGNHPNLVTALNRQRPSYNGLYPVCLSEKQKDGDISELTSGLILRKAQLF